MILYIDKIEKNEIGGFTTNLKKARYILAVHGMSFEEILSKTPKTTIFPYGMFISGKYVCYFNFSRDLTRVSIGFINHNIDLDEHFDVFADTMSPKAVAGFHELKEKIKLKDQSELNKVELSDNDSDFIIAYDSYLEYIKN